MILAKKNRAMLSSICCDGKPRTSTTTKPSLHGVTTLGDEFPRRLCDPLPPVILFYHVSLQPTRGNIKQQSQGLRGHRVYLGIRHPGVPYGYFGQVVLSTNITMFIVIIL